MSDTSLIHDADGGRANRKAGLRARSVRAFLGIRDPFQSATLKVLSGKNVKKYLSVIIDTIRRDHSKLEDFVVTCHALSLWSSKHSTCCNCLISLLVIIQLGPPVASTCIDPLTQFLSSIRDTWAEEDMFLSQFSILLLSRVNFLAEHEEFSNHFNLNATSSNGLSLPQIDPDRATSLLSQTLAMQGRSNSVIQLGLKNCQDVNYFRPKERDAIKSALFSLYEDAMCAQVASCTILQYVLHSAAKTSIPAAGSTMCVLRDLFNEQFAALRAAYLTLEAWAREGGGGEGGGYSSWGWS